MRLKTKRAIAGLFSSLLEDSRAHPEDEGYVAAAGGGSRAGGGVRAVLDEKKMVKGPADDCSEHVTLCESSVRG